jgi:hypothetical protein
MRKKAGRTSTLRAKPRPDCKAIIASSVAKVNPLRRSLLLDRMERAMFFLHLLRRNNSAAKVRQLYKLMLNCLQPSIPLSVSDLNVCPTPALTPKPLVGFLNLGDLQSEAPNFFAKNP